MKGTLQKENRAEVQRAPETVTPVVNIRETADGYLLEAEMPGVSKDGIEVTLENNEITIVGRRAQEPVAGEVLLRESRPVDYRRVFEMDPAIDPARISARIEQGLLTVVLPKSERVKPRRIAVD
jgi:HSP20 family protein